MLRWRVVHLRIPRAALNTRIPPLRCRTLRCPHTARGQQVKQVADRRWVFLEAAMRFEFFHGGSTDQEQLLCDRLFEHAGGFIPQSPCRRVYLAQIASTVRRRGRGGTSGLFIH